MHGVYWNFNQSALDVKWKGIKTWTDLMAVPFGGV